MNKNDIYGVILAGGKGSRFQLKGKNKTSVPFHGRPLVYHGAALFEATTAKTYVVVGAHADSVKEALQEKKDITYVNQAKRLGTGHAFATALKQIQKDAHPKYLLVGYGDHMMYYTKKVIRDLITLHENENAAISFITTSHNDPDSLAWGRVKRDATGAIIDVVEQKDATVKERRITELNAGFYCISYDFAARFAKKLHKSPVTGEYYINEFITLAVQHDLPVAALNVPFEYVGVGINSQVQLAESITLYSTNHYGTAR